MTDGQEDVLARLRQAVYDLEIQVNQTPAQARRAVWDSLDGILGVEYATHAVNRTTEDIRNITRQSVEQERTRQVS